ncbi:MAG: AI-2E family transporter [Desulfobacteraceae bacterium]|nr:AI-2E family transporter [Desulfobacteraceae bacterium]
MEKHGSKLFIIFLLGSLVLVLSLLWAYVSAIVLALLIASVLYPMYALIIRLFGGREALASLFMILFILTVLVIPASWFVGTLSNEAFEFYNKTRDSVSLHQIQQTLEGDSVWAKRLRKWGEMAGLEITPKTVENLASSLGKRIGLFLYSHISPMASNLLNFLVHFFLMMLTIYYLFRDGGRLKEYIIQLLPMPKEQLEKLANKFQEMGRAIIVGNGLSGIIQGILGGIGFFIFGLGSPFLWGTVLAFAAFLPIVGASAVFIPATAILMLQGKTGTAIGYLIYNMAYSSVIEYLVKPRLIGQGMKMNQLLVFIGIIGGMTLFGIMGLVYGPLIITIFLTLAEIYRLEYRDEAA